MKTAFFLLLCALFGQMRQTDTAGATCSCPDSRINHVSAASFGMTLLSPSFSSRYLNASSPQAIVIKEASAPIRFSDNDYYWDDGYHKSNLAHSSICTYRISYYNKELRKLRYSNGDRPTNITFGCHWYQECCDLGCCPNSLLQVVIYIMLYVGIGMMLMGFCAQLPGETEEERRIRRARIEAGLFFPCQRGTVPEPEPTSEEHALREIANQDAPPKYDDLYPTIEQPTSQNATNSE